MLQMHNSILGVLKYSELNVFFFKIYSEWIPEKYAA